jgi:hypothetical protein
MAERAAPLVGVAFDDGIDEDDAAVGQALHAESSAIIGPRSARPLSQRTDGGGRMFLKYRR